MHIYVYMTRFKTKNRGEIFVLSFLARVLVKKLILAAAPEVYQKFPGSLRLEHKVLASHHWHQRSGQ